MGWPNYTYNSQAGPHKSDKEPAATLQSAEHPSVTPGFFNSSLNLWAKSNENKYIYY